jgi:hypothetical protein
MGGSKKHASNRDLEPENFCLQSRMRLYMLMFGRDITLTALYSFWPNHTNHSVIMI